MVVYKQGYIHRIVLLSIILTKMSFLPTLRNTLPRLSRSSAARSFSSTPLRKTTAGYGDPQDEKIANETPGIKQQSSTAPEMKSHSGTEGGGVGSAGGKAGAGDQAKEDVTAKDIRETKKVGEEPKKTEEGGAGPKGG